MSSNYYVVCLSHDPALSIDVDSNCAETALDWARQPGRGLLEEHPHCDLMVVRSSGAPIEVACVSRPRGGEPNPNACYHSGASWAEVRWLRLLWHAQQAAEGTPMRADADKVRGCWTPTRLQRLRDVLDVARGDA